MVGDRHPANTLQPCSLDKNLLMDSPDKLPAKRRGRKPKPDAPDRGKRVRFIFEPDRSTPNGITFYWLIHQAYNGKEKAATAARSFWLPFAYRDSGRYSDEELRELAQQCIWRMEEQMQHLRESFGVELPIHSAFPHPVPQDQADSMNASEDGEDQTNAVADGRSSTTSLTDDNMLDDFADAL